MFQVSMEIGNFVSKSIKVDKILPKQYSLKHFIKIIKNY
jgi:hypothetical protein